MNFRHTPLSRGSIALSIALTVSSLGLAGVSNAQEAAPDEATSTDATDTVDTEASPEGDTADTAPETEATVVEETATPTDAPVDQTVATAPVAAFPPVDDTADASAVPASLGQKRNGFALELFLGINKPLIAIDEDFMDFNTISGGLFLGGKINRVIVGLGFEMSSVKLRSKYSSDYDGYNSESSESMIQFLFKPGVRFDIVRTKDEKVDLFGQVDVGMGTMLFNSDDNYNDYYNYDGGDEETYLLIDWDAGLGVRYWPHPNFAVSGTGALQGNYYREKDDDDTFSYHALSIVGSIQLLGVF